MYANLIDMPLVQFVTLHFFFTGAARVQPQGADGKRVVRRR
jgi:hypothetical protein